MAKEFTYSTQWYILITVLRKQNANDFIDVSIVFCQSIK